jgi:hypothetical protein
MAARKLKAALNHTYHDGKMQIDDAWRHVKPFHNVELPKIQYLTESECIRPRTIKLTPIKIALLLWEGILPPAYAYPAEMPWDWPDPGLGIDP